MGYYATHGKLASLVMGVAANALSPARPRRSPRAGAWPTSPAMLAARTYLLAATAHGLATAPMDGSTPRGSARTWTCPARALPLVVAQATRRPRARSSLPSVRRAGRATRSSRHLDLVAAPAKPLLDCAGATAVALLRNQPPAVRFSHRGPPSGCYNRQLGKRNVRATSLPRALGFLAATTCVLPSFSDLSTYLITPTATVWRMSRTAKRPSGGYSANDSTHAASSARA